MRKLGNIDDARDLCQETWLRIAEADVEGRPHAWPTDEAAKAYIFAVANHLLIDRYRYHAVRQSHAHEEQALDVGRQAPDVLDTISFRQALQAVDGAVALFPQRMREAFVRHRLNGERQEVLASELGVSCNTIERDLMQADQLLEEALQRWHGTPTPAASAVQESPEWPTHKRSSRRRALGYLLGLTAVAGTGYSAWNAWQQRLLWQTTLSSATGKMLTSRLKDGSVLQLDADSQVEVRYMANERLAYLRRGAAFFEVEREPERPFIVHAAGIRVRVLGTRFGVALEANGVLVDVEHGQVQVFNPQSGQSVLLGSRERVRVGAKADGVLEDRWQKQSSALPSPWRRGELEFSHEPLGQVIARLQRYSERPFRVASTAASLRISGHVRVEQARDWIQALSATLPVVVREGADGSTEIARR